MCVQFAAFLYEVRVDHLSFCTVSGLGVCYCSTRISSCIDSLKALFINTHIIMNLNPKLKQKNNTAVPVQRQQKQRQLLGRLQDLLLGPKADEHTTCEVLDYFLRRLSSSQVASRVLAMKVVYKAARMYRTLQDYEDSQNE